MQNQTHQQIREKYFKMGQTMGLDKAVTTLHNEVGVLEPKIYEGGFSQERFENVQFLRELARELWTSRLAE